MANAQGHVIHLIIDAQRQWGLWALVSCRWLFERELNVRLWIGNIKFVIFSPAIMCWVTVEHRERVTIISTMEWVPSSYLYSMKNEVTFELPPTGNQNWLSLYNSSLTVVDGLSFARLPILSKLHPLCSCKPLIVIFVVDLEGIVCKRILYVFNLWELGVLV